MTKSFEVQFDFGDEVCVKTDTGTKRQVSGYVLREKQVIYFLMKSDEETCHYEYEIEKFKEKKTGFGK